MKFEFYMSNAYPTHIQRKMHWVKSPQRIKFLDHMKEEPNVSEIPAYSFAAPPEVHYESDTEFGQRVSNMDINDVMTVMDELMTTLSVINPRLYNGVMAKL